MENSTLSEKEKAAVQMLFDAAKMMTPFVTGFLVVYGGLLGHLWLTGALSLKNNTLVTWLAAAPIVIGGGSMGLWSGAVPNCIMAIEFGSSIYFHRGQFWARTAHLVFVVAVALAMIFCLYIARTSPPSCKP